MKRRRGVGNPYAGPLARSRQDRKAAHGDLLKSDSRQTWTADFHLKIQLCHPSCVPTLSV